jgi:DNA-binding NarL/FixJ family response regulator
MSERIRVVVVDDHPMFCAGVIQTLKSAGDFNVLGQCDCAAKAVQLAKQLLPDVILLDVNLPGGGVDAGKEILRDCPEVRIIMLTVSDSEENVARCLKLGVRGYILKGAGQQELTSGVRAVYNGGMYLSPELLAGLSPRAFEEAAARSATDELTPREQEIVGLVLQGLTNKEIGENLSLRVGTIRQHVSRIKQKLRVHSRLEAVVHVMQTLE